MTRAPKYWKKAKIQLSKKDPVLRKIIKKFKTGYLKSKNNPFFSLCRTIIGQQISVKAADSIWLKFEKKCKKKITPKNVLKLSSSSLKRAGLSRQKISYLKSLSSAFLSNKIQPSKWSSLENEIIIQELIQIKGIGRWTAEMFLIFNLCRPDIFPADDLGLIKGICKCYNLNYPITRDHALQLSKKWQPWRSVATWYFWRSLDPIPVEY